MAIRTTRQRSRSHLRLIKNSSTNESSNTYTNKGSTGFTPTDEHILIDGTYIDYTTAITVGFWIKGPRVDTYASEGSQMAKYVTSDGSRVWAIGQSFNTFQVILHSTTDAFYRKIYACIEAGSYLNDATWRHWGFTFYNDTLTTYANGVQETAPSKTDDDTMTTLRSSPGTNITIGCRDPGLTTYRVQYPVSDCAIWDTALTAGQMAALYNSGTKPNLAMLDSAPNLKHWWRCDLPFKYPKIRDYAGDIPGVAVNMDSTNWNTP